MSPISRRRGFVTGLAFALAFCLPAISNADLAIPNSPLFLTNEGVAPNLIMTLDDSLSMGRGYAPESVGDDVTILKGKRFAAASVNGLYYNPKVTYPNPGGAASTTSFDKAWFNGFDTSTATNWVNLNQYQIIAQSHPSHKKSDCTVYVLTDSGDWNSCLYGYHAQDVTISEQKKLSTSTCKVTLTVNTGDDSIAVPNIAACSSFFSGIEKGAIVTISDAPGRNGTFKVISSPNGRTVTVNEPVSAGTNVSATISWNKYTASNTSPSKISAYYYIYYADIPMTNPSDGACLYRRDDDRCYEYRVVGAANDITKGDKKQNFANWYSFYRTRAMATMSAATISVNSLKTDSLRFGWQTINVCTDFNDNCQGYVTTNSKNSIRTINPTRISDFNAWISRFKLSGSTPLRSAFARVGEYFRTGDSGHSATPALDNPYIKSPNETNGDSVYSFDNKTKELSCRLNYHVLFTDGLWNSDSGINALGANFDPDSTGSLNLPLDEGEDTRPDYKTYTPRAPYRDRSDSYVNQYSLADIAFHYWASDLRDLPNNGASHTGDFSIPEGLSASKVEDYRFWNPKNDPATWQHLVNFTVGLGLSSSLQPVCYYNPSTRIEDPDSPNCPVWAGDTYTGGYSSLRDGTSNWPRINPSIGSNYGQEPDGHVYDLWHAAINSRGKFYSAENPVAVSTAFQDIVNTITAQANFGGGAGLNSASTQVDPNGTVVFEAKFRDDWSGALFAKLLKSDYSIPDDDHYLWEAGENIPAPNNRVIFTINISGGVEFRKCSDLPGALDTGTNPLKDDPACSKKLNWLRGDGKVTGAEWSGDYDPDTKKGTVIFTVPGHGFETGDKVTVSDIKVSEDPAPPLGYDGAFEITRLSDDQFKVSLSIAATGPGYYASGGRARYTAFRNRAHSMLGDIINSDPVYVYDLDFGYGDNASKIDAGAKTQYPVWNEHKASEPPYIFVGANDGMLHAFIAPNCTSVEDCISIQAGQEQFAYVPRGVYARLSELTDPAYTHRYYVDGPLSVGDAFIKSAWGTYLVGGLGAGGKSVYALNVTDPATFGNDKDHVLWEFSHTELGLTYSKPQIAATTGSKWSVIFGNGYNSGTRYPSLYVVDLATGQSATGSTNPNISATSSKITDKDNGLSTPYLYDSNGDKIVDVAYAGDLQGNLWKFVNTNGSWSIGNGGEPLFTAVNSLYQPQAITSQPKVEPHPTGTGVLIYFGTGRYLTAADTTNDEGQSFYAIWDSQGKPWDSNEEPRTVKRDQMQAYTVIEERSFKGYRVRTTTLANAGDSELEGKVNWTVKTGGWYLDLPRYTKIPSERIISTPLIMKFDSDSVPDRVLFVTNTPSADPCSRGGTTWLMELDLYNGGRTASSVYDFNKDNGGTVYDEKDMIDTNGDGIGDTAATGVALASGYGLTGEPLLLETTDGNIVKEFSGSTGSSGTAGGPLQKGYKPPEEEEEPTTITKERVYWKQIQ